MPDGVIPATIVFPIFNFALRAVQTSYEFASVQSETENHLKTISQVLLDLTRARALRDAEPTSLSDADTSRIDNVIKNTEEALAGLESLVERARVDMHLHQNSVGARARLMWVMRDSNKVNAALSRLTVVSQSLHSEILEMRFTSLPFREEATYQSLPKYSYPPGDHETSSLSSLRETTKSLAQRREWMSRRFPSTSSRSSRSGISAEQPVSFNPAAPSQGSTVLATPAQRVADWIRDNETILQEEAPISSAGPRNDLIPARIVNAEDNERTTFPLGFSELAVGPYFPPAPQPRSYTLSTSNLPFATSSIYDLAREPARQRDQSTSTTAPSTTRRALARPLRTSSGPANCQPTDVDTRTVSSAMHLTTQVPGQARSRLITWDEPVQEEPEGIGLPLNHGHSDTVESPPAYESVARPVISAGTRTTRRRTPRIYNTIEPVAAVIDAPAAIARSISTINNRGRQSRSMWALSEHESEATNIGHRRDC